MDRLAVGRRRGSLLSRAVGRGRWLAVAVVGVSLAGVLLFGSPLRDVLSRWFFHTGGAGEFVATVRGALDKARGRAPPVALDAACTAGAPDECGCVIAVIDAALAAQLSEPVLNHFDSIAPTCLRDPRVQGLRAQALAESGKLEPALVEAGKVLGVHPDERHASYARALALYKKGENETALEVAKRAVALGRGEPALLLQGLVHYARGEFQPATTAFEGVLSLNPKSVEAMYNHALCAHRLERYRDAREGYLRVLRLEPEHPDARYNLALLTHSFGAVAEARHHLSELQKTVPAGDERVEKLSALLGEQTTTPKPSTGAAAKRQQQPAPVEPR